MILQYYISFVLFVALLVFLLEVARNSGKRYRNLPLTASEIRKRLSPLKSVDETVDPKTVWKDIV